MTTSRYAFITAVVETAGQIATLLDDNPLRAEQAYPVADVIGSLAAHHDSLQRLLASHEGPVSVDPAGQPSEFGAELAGLMSYLQLLRVVYHQLDDIPSHMRVAANRNIAGAHRAARRVRDRGRRHARRNTPGDRRTRQRSP